MSSNENLASGGLCYYSQNKPGTVWVDRVDNKKGWTVKLKKVEEKQE